MFVKKIELLCPHCREIMFITTPLEHSGKCLEVTCPRCKNYFRFTLPFAPVEMAAALIYIFIETQLRRIGYTVRF
jgi:phage FluMu protein Com